VGLELDVMRYTAKKGTSEKIGHWSSNGSPRLNFINATVDDDRDEEEDLVDERVTLTVVTKEEKPYVYLREGKNGNDAFDGFAIDLLKVRRSFLFLLVLSLSGQGRQLAAFFPEKEQKHFPRLTSPPLFL